MTVIDSYCERILEKEIQGTVSVLPGGVSREEFVWRLDIMIKEVFSELTEYTESEYRCGKALLQLVKKYCFSKKALGNLVMEKDFADYHAKTVKMLDDEIARLVPDAEGTIPVIDADKAFTIISNAMQLLTSVIQVQGQEKEKTNAQVLGVNLPIMVDKQLRVSLERQDTAIENIIPYLDKVFDISTGFEKAKKNVVASKSAYVEWVEFKYLRLILELTRCKLDEIGVF